MFDNSTPLDELNLGNIFDIFYSIFRNIANICTSIWNWLNTDFKLKIFDFNIGELLGIETFKPLYITGAIILIFIVARIIKEFIPGA